MPCACADAESRTNIAAMAIFIRLTFDESLTVAYANAYANAYSGAYTIHKEKSLLSFQ